MRGVRERDRLAGDARHYVSADRALRAGRLPATGGFPVALVLAVAVVGVGLLIATAAGG
jgi:hypothetical protein